MSVPGDAPAAGRQAPAGHSGLPETATPLLLSGSLTLTALALLPLAQGGYSGAGYIVALVLLPFAIALGWPQLPQRPRLAEGVLLGYLLSALALPALVQEGRELWSWVLPLPLAWCGAWLVLNHVPERRGALLPVLVAGAAATALWGIVLWAASGSLATRLTSNFGLPNAYAGYLILAWPLAALALAQARPGRMRLAYAAALLLIVLALVLTYSRAGWLVFALQIGVLALCATWRGSAASKAAGQRTELPRWLPWGFCGLLLALLALPSVREVLARIADFGGYSVQGRLRFWEAAWAIWRDHPVTGVGLGNYGFVFPQYQRDPWWYSVDPHSWPLQLVSELGIPGLLLALGLLLGAVLWVRRLWARLDRWEAALLTVALAGSMAHAAVDFDFTFSATTSLLGALLAYGTSRARGANGELQPPQLRTASAASWAASILLLMVAAWGVSFSVERYCLDRLRDTPGLSAEVRQELLQQALHANPLNHQTHYRLAALNAEQRDAASLQQARRQVDRALELNPRYAPGWALRGLLKGPQGKGEADLAEALRLDPYNYPEHYFYYANLAPDEVQRRQRLEEGIERIQVAEPITPEHVRTDWVKLNGMFARWYYELGRLADNPHDATQLRETGAKFEKYAEELKRQ